MHILLTAALVQHTMTTDINVAFMRTPEKEVTARRDEKAVQAATLRADSRKTRESCCLVLNLFFLRFPEFSPSIRSDQIKQWES